MRHLTDEVLLTGLFADEVRAALIHEQREAEAGVEAERDLIGETLIADGYAPNDFILNLDATLGGYGSNAEFPYPWNLPSRMFIFPVRTERGPDGKRRLAAAHPLLMNHPLVQELISKGYEVLSNPDECLNEYGVAGSFYSHAEWHHAVDLIDKQPNELLDTRRFTTREHIFSAVSYRCSYPRESKLAVVVAEMRTVMTGVESQEPGEFEPIARSIFEDPVANETDPSTGKQKKNPTWPVNTRSAARERNEATAWAYIHGIERDWFVNKSGYLHWSELGRKELAKLPSHAPKPTPRAKRAPKTEPQETNR